MKKTANTTLIGAFVLSAIVLIIVGIMVFGGSKLLTKTSRFVLYFQGSIKGLNLGAPVKFRGVKIGSVSDIRIEYLSKDEKIQIPVIVEIYPETIVQIGENNGNSKSTLLRLIENGLRGQLQLESILTGQLFINLDFYPETAIVLYGNKKDAEEIPTIPSTVEELTKLLERIPLEKIANNALEVLSKINDIIEDPNVSEAVYDLQKILKLTQNLLYEVNKNIGPVSKQFITTAKDLSKALNTADEALQSFVAASTEGDNANYELLHTITEVGKAAQAIRRLVDYLEREPNALIFGKK